MEERYNDSKSPARMTSTSDFFPSRYSSERAAIAESKDADNTRHQDSKLIGTSQRLQISTFQDTPSSRLLNYSGSLSRLNVTTSGETDNRSQMYEGLRTTSSQRFGSVSTDIMHPRDPSSISTGRNHTFIEQRSGRFFPTQEILSNDSLVQNTIHDEDVRREEAVKFLETKARSLLFFAQGILAGVAFQSFYESFRLSDGHSKLMEKDESLISYQIYFFFSTISLVGCTTKIRLRQSSTNEAMKSVDCLFICSLANTMMYSISLLLTHIILVLELVSDNVDEMIILGLILMRSCCCLLGWILNAWNQEL